MDEGTWDMHGLDQGREERRCVTRVDLPFPLAEENVLDMDLKSLKISSGYPSGGSNQCAID